MLRALTSTLRFPRPWRPLETRGCSSNPGAAGREIQVCALAGPDQGIAEILMNRPSARNALGNVFVSQLLEALAQLREDRQVRVLIFRSGVKGVFCAGADLKEREQMSEAEVGVFVQRLRGLMTEIAAFPAPTIAAMDGFALGGGLELALACDLRVAASSAVMGLIETTRGLLPGAGGTQRLPRCLGVALAKELIFTGRRLSGAQAQALGLVNHAVAQNEEGNAAYHRARALAQEILPQVRMLLSTGRPVPLGITGELLSAKYEKIPYGLSARDAVVDSCPLVDKLPRPGQSNCSRDYSPKEPINKHKVHKLTLRFSQI